MPPKFVEDRRAAALEVYEREPVPTWRRSGFWTTTLRHLRLEELEPKRYDAVSERPEIVANDELAAVIVQRGASDVHHFFFSAAFPCAIVTASRKSFSFTFFKYSLISSLPAHWGIAESRLAICQLDSTSAR